MSSAVVDPVACAGLPAVAAAIERWICPVWTPDMEAQAALYPANLPTIAAINITCHAKENIKEGGSYS